MRDLQYLVVAGLFANYHDLVELVRLAYENDMAIVEMQTQHPSAHYMLTLFLQGKWNAIAKMEKTLTTWQQKTQLSLQWQRTILSAPPTPALTYLFYLSTTEESDTLYRLLLFFHNTGISLQNIHIDRHLARYTQTPMINMTLRIHLSTEFSIGDWRERLMLFCDELNIDAALEPEKG